MKMEQQQKTCEEQLSGVPDGENGGSASLPTTVQEQPTDSDEQCTDEGSGCSKENSQPSEGDNNDYHCEQFAGLDGKLVKNLSYEAHRIMYRLLAPPNSGRDWKTLAHKMGISNQDINYYACHNERAVEKLIKDYEDKDKTVAELLSLLREMERADVIEDVEEHIATMPTQKVLEERQTQIWKHQETKTFSESYDAIVCYAEPDVEFANKIVKKLEGPPYHMKVCIDYRDFVPGACYAETAATVIEKRCKKVLVILSENFNNCEKADQQAKIALSLSPGARQALLIPILYKPCEVPITMRFLDHLNYTRDDTRKYFWYRLTRALGYTENSGKSDKRTTAPGSNVKMTAATETEKAATDLDFAASDGSAATNEKAEAATKPSAATGKNSDATKGACIKKQSVATDKKTAVTLEQSADSNKNSAGSKNRTSPVRNTYIRPASAKKRNFLLQLFRR